MPKSGNAPENHRCPNCGYCEHCGQSTRRPRPEWPWFPMPYRYGSPWMTTSVKWIDNETSGTATAGANQAGEFRFGSVTYS